MLMKVWSNFKKDKKSTKTPVDSDAREVTITLKEDTSLMNPTFILRWDVTPEFNYCQYILSYYYVNDVVMRSKDVYEIQCTIDFLATYKADILASSQFVLRSATDFNINLYDNIFEPELEPIITTETTQSPLDATGTYIVKYSSSTSARFGVTYRCGTASEIGNFVSGCYDLNNWDDFLTTGLESLQKTVFDFSQYLQEIYWLPITKSDIPNRYSIVPFVGAWQITSGEQGTEEFLGTEIIKIGQVINTHDRYYNDFRDYSPAYTKFYLSIPGVGEINLDPKDVYSGLGYQWEIDLKTGDAKHVISTGSNVVSTIRSNYKMPVSYATFNNNFVTGANQLLSAASSIGSGIGGAVSGNYGGAVNDVSNGIASITSGLVNLDNITSHQVSAQGTQGDLKSDTLYRLCRYVYPCAEEPRFNIGRKLNKYRTLSGLQGFVQCQNAYINTSAYSQIKDAIENTMNTGFIIE